MTQPGTPDILDIVVLDSPINIVDIGASLVGDQGPSYQTLLDSGHARLIAFEPDGAALAALRERFPPPNIFLPHFVADGKPATFHETSWYATGSLFEPNIPLLEQFNNLAELTKPVARHPIQTVRLDDIDGISDVDFIKIDAQGAERLVFENATRVLSEATIIQTEVSFVEMYKGMPLFGDIDRVLRAAGFQWHFLMGTGQRAFPPVLNRNHTQSAFKQQLWGDVVYVRDWMQFAQVQPRKLVKLGVVLNQLYGSYDLAHKALAEADRQAGTDCASRYLRLLRKIRPEVKVDIQSPSTAQRVKSRPGSHLHFIEYQCDAGLWLSLPADVDCISTYVLLEQRRWFEKEIAFIHRFATEGMIALDIGANIGVYATPLAKLVGRSGKVIAYEPSANNREHLCRALSLNGIDNVEISPCALSSYRGQGVLQLSESGELHQMVSAPSEQTATELIDVTTLDVEARQHDWMHVDFVKLDAEGQESAILEGALDFFVRYSPLVMFEIKHQSTFHFDLMTAFQARGFSIYRLLGDSSILAPIDDDEAIDSYELNVFAAKPDQAEALARRGLLALECNDPSLTAKERELAVAAFCESQVSRELGVTAADVEHCPYGEALVAYCAYKALPSLPSSRRLALLRRSLEIIESYCQTNNTLPGLISLARIAAEFGRRGVAIEVLHYLLSSDAREIDQPFLALIDDFPGMDRPPLEWFPQMIEEALELQESDSGLFQADMARLYLLAENPFATPAILRRRIVAGLLHGESLQQMEKLLTRLREAAPIDFAEWHEALRALAATIVTR